MVLDQLEKRGSTDSVSGEDDEAIVAAGGVGKDNVPTALRLSPNAEGIFDDSDDDRRTTAQEKRFLKLLWPEGHLIRINDEAAARFRKHMPHNRFQKKTGKEGLLILPCPSTEPMISVDDEEFQNRISENSVDESTHSEDGRNIESESTISIAETDTVNGMRFRGVLIKVRGSVMRGDLVSFVFRIYCRVNTEGHPTEYQDVRHQGIPVPKSVNSTSTIQDFPGLELLFQRTISSEMLLFSLLKVKKRYPSLPVPDCHDLLNIEQFNLKHGIISAGKQLERRLNTFLNLSFTEDAPDLPALLFGRPGGRALIPKINIIILLIGSRGDIQPFIALANELLKLGHRVRIATHKVFEEFVKNYGNEGVEFYSIGGDPVELMEYMVCNPGLIPKDIREIPRKRNLMKSILWSSWPACYEPDPITGRPFLPGLIIANPVCIAHIHLAEKLQIPCHLFFTMPWSPTEEFSHPFAMFTKDPNPYQRYISYFLVDKLLWLGLHSIINEFRKDCLGLLPIRESEDADSLVHTLRVPCTYCWSPSLVPKPHDWESHIDVCGFFFLNSLSIGYQPPQLLVDFLKAGAPPIYVGFGSIVVDEIDTIYDIIIEALNSVGGRALIDKGWSKGRSKHDLNCLPNIMFIDNCPHDWLFPRCSAVCHHGGAGTLAAGLKAGCPTIVIPFFGDQFYWGNTVRKSKLGPTPIEPKSLTVAKFVKAIRYCMRPSVLQRVKRISKAINNEDGVKEAVVSLTRQLPLDQMQCEVCLHAFELAVTAETGDASELPLMTESIQQKMQQILPSATDHPLISQIFLATFAHNMSQIKLCVLCHYILFNEEVNQDGRSSNSTILSPDIQRPSQQCSTRHIVDWTWKRKMKGITGITSGIRIGCRSCRQTLVDGITSLRTSPGDGWRSGGWGGCTMGILIGFSSMMIKPLEAIFYLAHDICVGIKQSCSRLGIGCQKKKKHTESIDGCLPPKYIANAKSPLEHFDRLSMMSQETYRILIRGAFDDLLELKKNISKMKIIPEEENEKSGGWFRRKKAPICFPPSFDTQDPRLHIHPFPLLANPTDKSSVFNSGGF